MRFLLLLATLAFSYAANATLITFDTGNISGYGNQAVSGGYSVFDVGTNQDAGLSVVGNYWVDIDLSTLPSLENTILTFEFMTDDLGELHGLGFDDDDSLASSGGGFALFFQLAGTQTLGNQDYRVSAVENVWQTFVIDFSAFDLSQYDRIFFAADMDGGDNVTSSLFRNLTISSSSTINVSAPSTLTLLSFIFFVAAFRARRKLS